MRFLRLPKFISFLAYIFDRKNDENHQFWPPKTLPKPFQNASQIALPGNMQFFIVFFAVSLFFLMSDFLECVIFPGENQYFESFAKDVFLQRSIAFASQNLSKTLPKRLPKPSKIDVENRLFFNVDFFGFRLHFETIWASKLGAKIAMWAWQAFSTAPL